MTTLDLAIVPWGVWANEFVTDTQLRGGFFKESNKRTFAGTKAIGKLKVIIGLNALDNDSPGLK